MRRGEGGQLGHGDGEDRQVEILQPLILSLMMSVLCVCVLWGLGVLCGRVLCVSCGELCVSCV